MSAVVVLTVFAGGLVFFRWLAARIMRAPWSADPGRVEQRSHVRVVRRGDEGSDW